MNALTFTWLHASTDRHDKKHPQAIALLLWLLLLGLVPSVFAQAPSAPTNLTATPGSGQVMLTWNAPSGSVTSYTEKRSTTSGGPYTIIASGTTATSYTDTSAGSRTTYYYVVSATNASDESPNSTEVSATPPSAASGLLVGMTTPDAGTVNLTQEGTLDWAHWGSSNAGSFDDKATGGSQISNVTTVGPGNGYGNSFWYPNSVLSHSWSDGTPTANATSVQSGIFAPGAGDGYSITVPADTSLRTLKLYLGGWNATGLLQAHLSDSSAADYTDSSYSDPSGSTFAAQYILTYQAASPGQTLTITWTAQTAFNPTWGNVTLQAATLSAASFAPTGLAAYPGNHQVLLLWKSPVKASSYTVKRSTTSGGPYTPLSSGITATSYVDISAENGTTYYYVVSAVNAAGNSFDSAEVPATPSASISSNIYQINCGGSATGSFAADNYFSGGSTAGTTAPIDLSQVSNPAPSGVYQSYRYGSCSYALPGLQPGAAYTVRLHFAEVFWQSANLRLFGVTINGTSVLSSFDAFAAAGGMNKAVIQQFNTTADSNGNINLQFTPTPGSFDQNPLVGGIEVIAGASAPAPPVNLTATVSNGQVALAWNAVSGATSYTVQRSTVSGGPYTPLDTPAGTTYTDTDVTDGTTYYYVVSATNASGTSPQSSEVSATPLSAPTDLVAQAGNQQVALSWTAVSGATGYTVKGSPTSGGPYTNITYAGGVRGTTFTNQYLTNGTTYYYVVTAVNSSGESANSNEASAIPVGPPVAPTNLVAQPGYQQVTLTWTASAVTDGYNLYRGTSPGGESAAPINAAPISGTSFTDIGLTSGTTYYYTVVAVNSYGASPQSGEASTTLVLPPDSPAALVATPGTGQVALSWTAPPGSVTSYSVQRATTAGGPYIILATGTTTSYADTAVVNGTPYFYVVTASNLSGPGIASDEAMAEPFASPAAPSVTQNYGYSSGGLRAWKQVAGNTTYFLYDGSNPVCELDGSGNVLATNTWGGGLLSRHAGTASTFYTFDPAGNVAQRLDSSGNVLGAYAFDAFGLRTGTDTTTDPYSSFGGQWGYYADAETGLELLGHRYYDAGTGRFINRDPLGYAGGSNLYAYAGNNPVMLADPSGFCPDGGGPGSGGSQGGGYDPTNPFGPDGAGNPNGPLTGKSGNPGFNPGSPQNNAVNNMADGFGGSLKMAVGGAALGMAGSVVRGLGGAAEEAEAANLANTGVKVIEQDGQTFHWTITNAKGTVEVMAEVEMDGSTMTLNGAHVYTVVPDGVDAAEGANTQGRAGLNELMQMLGNQYNATKVIINGGMRATGPNAGTFPKPVIFNIK